MKRAILVSISLIAVILSLLGGGKFVQITDMIKSVEATALPVPFVSTELVREINWQSNLYAVGELEAAQGVVITADVAGRVAKINFQSGTQVSAGDLLVEQEYSAEETELEAANANASLAESNLNRTVQLDRDKLIARSEIDLVRATYKSAVANARAAEARLLKKQVRAPFSGRLGLRKINVGQNISAGTPIVSLQAAGPMLINFSLPQQHTGKLQTGYTVRAKTDAAPDQIFTGQITAINSQIDARTRTISLQATLANPNGVLVPGMFASVEIVLPTEIKAMMVPVTSISHAPYGDSVFIVEEQPHLMAASPEQPSMSKVPFKATQKFVQLGQVQGDFVTVLSGLEPGDRIVSAGGFKLHNGSEVFLN